MAIKTVPVKVGGKTFQMAFTLDALADLQDIIKGFDMNKVTEYARTPRALGDLVYILSKHGERLEGRELPVDRDWIGAHIPPSPVRIATIQVSVLNALAEGLTMETEEEESEEVDEALEEIKKKDGKDASPGA